jgi:hypothetical protein
MLPRRTDLPGFFLSSVPLVPASSALRQLLLVSSALRLAASCSDPCRGGRRYSGQLRSGISGSARAIAAAACWT